MWDVVIDPVIGALTDRDLARHGSRRRLMLIGALALPVLFALTFAVPPSLGPVVAGIWVLLAVHVHGDRLQPVPGALHRAARRAHTQLRRAHAPADLARRGAHLRDPAVRAGGPALRRVSDDPFVQYLVMGVVCGVVIGIGMLVATAVARRGAAGPTRPEDPTGVPAASPSTVGIGASTTIASGIRALRRSKPFPARSLVHLGGVQALAGPGLGPAGRRAVRRDAWALDSEAAVETAR